MAELKELCDALERNDPNVTTVSTYSLIRENPSPDDDFEDLTLRLGAAIRQNTFVSDFEFDLALLVDVSNTSIPDDASAPLIGWIQDSPALRSVRLLRTMATGSMSFDEGRCGQRCPEPVIRTVLLAIAKNPHIRELRSNIFNLSWPSLTEYVTSNKLLDTLWLEGWNVLGDERDVLAAAQAIGALTALEALSLPAEEAFLPLLQSRSNLRKLRLKFKYDDPAVNTKMQSLASSMMTCTNLTSVALAGLTMDRECWGLVESGFRANSAIAHFQLELCTLKQEAIDDLFAYMRSNDVNVQPVRDLELADHTGRSLDTDDIATKIAEMLRGSLLDHISFCALNLDLAGTAALFDDLTANTDKVRVKSIHLDSIKCRTLRHVGQYIATAVHLCNLAFNLYDHHYKTLRERGRDPKVRVPHAFLLGLRQNGSVHSVKICSDEEGFPSDNALRFIDAYTSRNRLVPKVLQDLFHCRREAKENHSDSALEPLPSLSLVPTLCKAAMQADRMAPNTVLRGLQVGLQEIGRSGDSGEKRLNSQRATGRC